MLITCRPAYTYISYQGHGVSSPHWTSNITHNVDDTDNESRPSHGEGHGVSSSPGAGNEFVNMGDNYIDESRASPRW